MNLYPDFAEGDSGVTLSPVIAAWNEIQSAKSKRDTCQLSVEEFQAEVLELARDTSASGDARASAYKLAWDIGVYRAMSEVQTDADT